MQNKFVQVLVVALAAFAPAAMKRLATVADGWNPVMVPVDGMAQMFTAVKQMAKDAGRDPSSLAMVVRANLEITDKPLGDKRTIFSGTIRADQRRHCPMQADLSA